MKIGKIVCLLALLCLSIYNNTLDAQNDVYDLALIKELGTPGPFFPGDDVIFVISVCNQGTIVANEIELIDYIPISMTLSINDLDGWTINPSGNAIKTLINLGSFECESVLINLTISPSFIGNLISNNAEILSDDGDDIDSTPGDNAHPHDFGIDDDSFSEFDGGDDEDAERIIVMQPPGTFDLALLKSLHFSTQGPFEPNDDVTFNITVFNQGNVDAFSIGIIDYIPDGLTLNDSNWSMSGTTAILVNPISEIDKGRIETVTITFTIDDSFGGEIINDAEILFADDDLDPNNSAPLDIDSTPGDNAFPLDTSSSGISHFETNGSDDQDGELVILNCPEDFAGTHKLSGLVNNSQLFNSEGKIESCQNLVNGASVIYNSGTSVLFMTGFEISSDAILHAFIHGCNN